MSRGQAAGGCFQQQITDGSSEIVSLAMSDAQVLLDPSRQRGGGTRSQLLTGSAQRSIEFSIGVRHLAHRDTEHHGSHDALILGSNRLFVEVETVDIFH